MKGEYFESVEGQMKRHKKFYHNPISENFMRQIICEDYGFSAAFNLACFEKAQDTAS